MTLIVGTFMLVLMAGLVSLHLPLLAFFIRHKARQVSKPAADSIWMIETWALGALVHHGVPDYVAARLLDKVTVVWSTRSLFEAVSTVYGSFVAVHFNQDARKTELHRALIHGALLQLGVKNDATRDRQFDEILAKHPPDFY